MIAALLVYFGDDVFSFFFGGSPDDDTDDGIRPPADRPPADRPPIDRRIFDDSDGADDGTIRGTAGNDQITGSTTAQGFEGGNLTNPDDTITALGGDNFLDAGLGNDIVNGGAGRDTIYGGTGDGLFDDAPGFESTSDPSRAYGNAGNDVCRAQRAMTLCLGVQMMTC